MTRFSFLWFFFFFLLFAPPAKAEFIHAVKPGESLSSMENEFHLSVAQVQEADELDREKLHPGQRLVTAAGHSRPLSLAEAKGGIKRESGEIAGPIPGIPEIHVVKKGETLARIAHRYNLQVRDLQEMNQLPGTRIKAGQILLLQWREEDREELEASIQEPEGKKIEARAQVPKVHVSGYGFLMEEKDRQLLVRVARAFLGLKYQRGGTGINGMDCSAFVQKVFQILGIDLPRTVREQFQVGFEVAREALQMGDLVFFKRGKTPRPTHVGIYIGNGQFIHTSLQKQRVEIDSLESLYFSVRFVAAKRIEGKMGSDLP